MKKLLMLALSLFAATSIMAAEYPDISIADLKKAIADGKVTVIDVRTSDEFSEGHIKDAKNIDIMSPDFSAKLGALDKTKPVLVHCQAGGRSTRSLPTFEKLGFTEIYHLDGGMNDWNKAGQPVVK